MTKQSLLIVFASLLVTRVASADVTIHMLNHDTSTRTFKASCVKKGSSSKAPTTITVSRFFKGDKTLAGSGPCKITHAGGELEVKSGDYVKVRDSKLEKTGPNY